ncbi:MAG: DUF3305 domain-containing protein [Proteobacteria bacterium]|jgi:hypothetical protein|nr:DUF3305 domain-containing protein [Pseudomonadota bacterium]
MAALRRTVDVVMERVPLSSRWATERWQPVAVVDAVARSGVGVPAVEGSGMIASDTPEARRARGIRVPGTFADGRERWICPGFEIELHKSEGEGLFLNMTSPDPRVFVMWRMFDDGRVPRAWPVFVTVSYNQAARSMDGGEQVDNVPMPAAIAQWTHEFVAANYVPEPRRKVRRRNPLADDGADGADPKRPRLAARGERR